jgi:hypothetical protein
MASLRDAAINLNDPSRSNPYGQFLNPEAMLTPGLAGALVMMITNGLALNFSVSRAYTGLFLSFIFGLLVLVVDRRLWIKIIYWVINSLIIFCVAFGASGVGAGVAGASLARLDFAPIAIALAEPMSTAKHNAVAPHTEGQPSETTEPPKNTTEQPKPNNNTNRQQRSFFEPWTFR